MSLARKAVINTKKINQPASVKSALFSHTSVSRGHFQVNCMSMVSFCKLAFEATMKNTRIPLDIGYFSPKGKLMEIHAAKPFDLNGVPSHSKNIQFVLELNLHDFRNQKIKIGDRLDLSEIRNAIKLRGLNPKNYQLHP